MELIHIVRTRHVQSINNVHRLNMGVKSKKLSGLLKSKRVARTRANFDCRLLGCSKDGGANRDRTGDLLVANQTLSQLSYGPVRFVVLQTLVGLAGVAPATSPLSGVRSN